MSDLPVELDLKFLPSWLKEEPSPNRYADFEGESPDRARRDDRRGGGGFSGERRGPRPAGGPRPGGPGDAIDLEVGDDVAESFWPFRLPRDTCAG